MTSAPSGLVLPSSAIGGDTETFPVSRALQAPPIVTLQWGDTSGAHTVCTTRQVRDGIAHMFHRDREQIWWHNCPFDLACILEWYPEFTGLVWSALMEGRVFDTMYLQRLAQIARGEMGGGLGLDMVAMQYGIRPPTKEIEATHPDYPGQVFDVRTSLGLWYMADSIPEPWYGYADYDGEVMLPLASRMWNRLCVPPRPGAMPLVDPKSLTEVIRTYFGLHLARVWGLKVDTTTVGGLERAARAALARLQDAARMNGFLKPVAATKADIEAGKGGPVMCPAKWERPSAKADAKALAAFARRQAKHADCQGCRRQVLDDGKQPVFSKDTHMIKAAVVTAYEGKPPLTEKTKHKLPDGKVVMRGGGNVATSRHVLEDSHNEELTTWSEYNEWGTLMAKDMPIFARGVVHTRIGMANTGRPTSSDPNILNFRRNSFWVGTCPNPECGYEMTLDPGELKTGTETLVLCPMCEAEVTEETQQ
jgi:hypothetical protein